MTFDFNLKHLRALRLITKLGSISAAAKAIGLSQPALTQGLAGLESRFGVRLFERLPQGLQPTAVGSGILARTERAMEHFTAEIRSSSKGRSGSYSELYLTSVQIRTVLSLARTGDPAEAMPSAGSAKSSIQRSLKDLERITGTTLTVRLNGELRLNEAGHRLARGFGLGVSELDIAMQEATRQPQRVVVGAMALSRSMLIPLTLATFHGLHPHVQIDVVDGSYGELVEGLRDGTIDMVIGTLRDAPAADVQQEVLLQDSITVIGRRDHPLASKNPSLEDLALFPWVVGRRTSALLERWQRIFDEAGVPRPRAPIHCGSVTTIRGLLVRTDFLTLLSRDQVEVELNSGLLVVVESKIPDTIRVIGAITRRSWFPSVSQRRFLISLREVANRLTQNGDGLPPPS